MMCVSVIWEGKWERKREENECEREKWVSDLLVSSAESPWSDRNSGREQEWGTHVARPEGHGLARRIDLRVFGGEAGLVGSKQANRPSRQRPLGADESMRAQDAALLDPSIHHVDPHDRWVHGVRVLAPGSRDHRIPGVSARDARERERGREEGGQSRGERHGVYASCRRHTAAAAAAVEEEERWFGG